jgi:hypothetical protein
MAGRGEGLESKMGTLRMAGRGEGLESKMGTLRSGTGGGSRGRITGIGLMGVDGSILGKGTAAVRLCSRFDGTAKDICNFGIGIEPNASGLSEEELLEPCKR